MTKYLFHFFLILSSSCTLSQEKPIVELYFGKTKYIPATVELNNGKVIMGEVQDFDSPNLVKINNPFGFEPKELEPEFNLDRKKIKFRTNASEKEIQISADSIDQISYFDKELNEVKEFKRLQILKTNNNGEIYNSGKSFFLPLIKKDSINYYGYNVIFENRYVRTVFYMNNSKDNLAINPLDFSLADLFKKESTLQTEIINILKYITKDCPEFHKKIEEKPDVTKEMKKDALQKYKKMESDIKEGKKKLKTSKEKIAFESEVYSNFYLTPFMIITEDYKNLCK
ncbi:Protein of unknown function [Flavobacterium indicum GPTSA100-9 = DSM 17447]|uniref:Lipoprotein n=1 Tax=Flavobacterium indicum (strain DSM 17447 / CIP 109464 / GPTSA100-9) TaxID=1094466 RepID=H8XPE9_FLAIG|nr:hypothetical protein [Flavobacterium indicum]CCG53223.1 Protein of unknown function [Flavobacterium indicum GPTSA100-9 = DSM 17447]